MKPVLHLICPNVLELIYSEIQIHVFHFIPRYIHNVVTPASLVTKNTDTFSIDACVIRRGLLWLRGCRGLEDWPMLLQTRPRGSHFHGDGELCNRADRWRLKGRREGGGGGGGVSSFILCQWTPECLFSHLSPRWCSLGCGYDSGKRKEKQRPSWESLWLD